MKYYIIDKYTRYFKRYKPNIFGLQLTLTKNKELASYFDTIEDAKETEVNCYSGFSDKVKILEAVVIVAENDLDRVDELIAIMEIIE